MTNDETQRIDERRSTQASWILTTLSTSSAVPAAPVFLSTASLSHPVFIASSFFLYDSGSKRETIHRIAYIRPIQLPIPPTIRPTNSTINMRLSAPIIATLTSLTTALPTKYSQNNNTTNATIPTDFLLLTTTSSVQAVNTTHLSSVSATSLFDPRAHPDYLLRLTGPGYGSLPRFNLTTDGKLETEASGPHGVGEFEYNSTRVRAGEDLMFSSDVDEGKAQGNLGLKDGFLLTVGGEAVGWRVCDGELGQRVVSVISCSFDLDSNADFLFCRLPGRVMMRVAPTLLCRPRRMHRIESRRAKSHENEVGSSGRVLIY